VGQEIGFDDVRGRITMIHSTSTILDAGQGRSVRIPNHLLLDAIVTIYGSEQRQGAEND
jgi:small-conductance mechanosensitive channel